MHVLARIAFRCKHPLSSILVSQSGWNHVAVIQHDLLARQLTTSSNHHHHHRASTMSSSEGENFELDNISGSESDGYTPVKKKSVSLVESVSSATDFK
jgi:hypothetical protein